MPNLRLALSQTDPWVGDIARNCDEVVRWTREAAEAGAQLVAFPEMVLTGYPVEDLALRSSFVEASREALVELAGRLAAEGLGELPVLVGYLGRSERAVPNRPAGSPQNCAAVLHRGEVVNRFAKHYLPNYGVFDEHRYFVPGDQLSVLRLHGVDVALAICEDIWQDGGRVSAAREAGAGLLLVINGSPYERNKDDARLELARRRAAEAGCPLAYVNMVGAQDELVFDGDSLVVGAEGEVIARAPQFEEALLLVDLELAAADGETKDLPLVDGLQLVRTELGGEPEERKQPVYEPAPRLSDEAEIYGALVEGTRAYVRKNGFRSVLIGLSGGIDSALVAAIAVDAIGAANVYCVSMPSRYSSQHSRDDAAELAERTGLNFRTVPIAPMFDAYMEALGLTGLAEENLQSRLRGTLLMAISNQEGHIVLAPGNKSELAVGYSTLYGDSVGAYGPIKDVYKSLIFRLATWRNELAEERGEVPPIPANTISKPPSAELRPDQVDTDSLPDYDLLDTVLDLYIEGDQGRDAIVAQGFDPAVVDRIVRLVDTAEYKRRQYPPGPKISRKGFGRDRRLPVTNRWRRG
ncbi:NAD+ synthase (glutamine-hydrolyzing) [Kitasatospora gansuensis]|uniref:Glutamine-dependent NAD(+) synthetase n=1 Tax=Kitasatospora gansuensis TaxID=258050 RepID=A0A7W7SG19_9ACTN|nr:NAD+ synthase [Kitasatospora gansuensis]MBB4949821.1 NAD+ synthase (glutamine-hydrolyzing) [Kitasatospora gansuensis]